MGDLSLIGQELLLDLEVGLLESDRELDRGQVLSFDRPAGQPQRARGNKTPHPRPAENATIHNAHPFSQ
jgi:hypothetical protein